jgi:hypothetical protein
MFIGGVAGGSAAADTATFVFSDDFFVLGRAFKAFKVPPLLFFHFFFV